MAVPQKKLRRYNLVNDYVHGMGFIWNYICTLTWNMQVL